jgi:hypothetical protein
MPSNDVVLSEEQRAELSSIAQSRSLAAQAGARISRAESTGSLSLHTHLLVSEEAAMELTTRRAATIANLILRGRRRLVLIFLMNLGPVTPKDFLLSDHCSAR